MQDHDVAVAAVLIEAYHFEPVTDVQALLHRVEEMRGEARFDEADDLVRRLLYPYPAGAEVMTAYAFNAMHRRDWPEALDRWEAVAAAHPDLDAPVLNKALVLRELGRLDECDAMLCTLRESLPDNDAVLYHWCLNPHYMQAWSVAADRWIEFRQRWPDNPASYAWGTGALREMGRLDEAKALLGQAGERFRENVQIEMEHALLCGRCGAWDDALRRWDALCAADPLSQDLRSRREEARLMAAYAGMDGEGKVGPEPMAAARHDAGTVEAGAAAAERSILFRPERLLVQFESLGSDCEVGLLQRRYGCEPLGLLRWGGPVIGDLISALEHRFAGLGEAGTLRLEATPSEYLLHDDSYRILMHTFIPVDASKEARILQQLERRMVFLRRILIDQIAAGDRVFVFKDVLRADRSTIIALHRQMRRLGPANLLVVQTAGPGCEAADVEQVEDGLFVGTVSAFGNRPLNADGSWNTRVQEWLNLFRIVYAALRMQ